MSIDNPYYFYNERSPKTPDSNSNRGFSIFKRRNSKGNSPKVQLPGRTRSINSATLSSDASILGSPRGSLASLASSFSGNQSVELTTFNNFNSPTHRRSSHNFRDRLGSYSESCHYNGENDDVFIPMLCKTQTLPVVSSNGIRRHSVGNFANRDRSKCESFSDEVPNMMAPKPPIMSPHSKYKSTSRRKDNCSGSSNMDDILIVTAKHSERAILWANFLKSRFDKITKQRGRKPFNFLHIKIDDGKFSPEIAQKCKTTALQIIILCPSLLALPHSFLLDQFTSIVNVEKVLGILLDVKEEVVLDMHKSALPSYRRWRRCAVRDNDQSLIGNILGIATDILGRALCQRPLCNESNGSNLKNLSNSDGFTITPKKVKMGQNKVLALLTEPLTKTDVVKVTIENNGETMEITNVKQRNPYTLQFCIPDSCMEISTMIEVCIDKNDAKLGNRPIKCESRVRELEILLRTQDSPIEFMCQSLGIGTADKDALDIHLLECFQKNMPPNFHLLSGLYENKQNNLLYGSIMYKESSVEEFPTLLHFAAKWGFERLCMQLMECPGGDAACGIINSLGRTPSQIADQEGYNKLATSIKSFAKIHEFTNIYHYFKDISETNSKAGKTITHLAVIEPTPKINEQMVAEECNDGNYMEMRNGVDNENSITRTTLAVSNLNYLSVENENDVVDGANVEISKRLNEIRIIDEEDKDDDVKTNELKINEPPYYQSKHQPLRNSPPADKITKSSPSGDKFSQDCSNVLENFQGSPDYVLTPSNKPVNTQDNGNYLFPTSNRPIERFGEYMNTPSSPVKTANLSLSCKFLGNGTLKRSCSNASTTTKSSNADDELAEIMYDFKNNVLTIKEVEELVGKWKNRNDVKQSFKEKQDQIEKLREEYEKLQDQMKVKLKRDTPFDRFKKIFSRQKHETELKVEDPNETASSLMSYQSSTGHRPISTLSLHSVSSSSSGRLSTGSGTSLGDSGTHSDHEDRRQNSFSSCRLGSPGSLIDNYLVPPVNPRPVSTPSSTPGEEKDQLYYGSRVHTPTSPNPNSEHYIMFPSNVPVSQNNSYLNTIIEVKEYDPSQKKPTIQPIKVQNGNERNTSYIIYGKLTKAPPKDFCSSFKQPAPQIKSEDYQNVSSTDSDNSHNYINI